MLEIDEMKNIWMDILEHQSDRKKPLFLNHQILKVNHPEIGHYEVQVWHSEMAFDERFVIVQHIPNDVQTSQLFKELQKKYVKSDKMDYAGE